MGKKENPFVWYFDQNINFAELADGWLFHGQGRIRPDDISPMDRRAFNRHRTPEPYPLCHARANYGLRQCLLCRARDDIKAAHEEAKDLKGDEFLSGFSRTDRLTPVITLVLYYGDKPWDGATCLHDILDFEFPPDIYTFFLFLKYKDDPEKLKTALTDSLLVRGIEREKKNTERERLRAEKAEARVRELERMLRL